VCRSADGTGSSLPGGALASGPTSRWKRFRGGFLDRVVSRLSSSGFRVNPAFPVAGMVVDLVVERKGNVFGIDLIGQSETLGTPLDLER